MNSKKCLFSIIFITVLSLFISANTGFSPTEFPISSSITSDPAILIDSDADFISLGCPGSGNETSPYIISDFIIDVSGFLNDGILVEGTTKHFIIENCTVYTDYIGIRLMNVAPGTGIIQNNTCIAKSNDGGGIGVGGTDILILNNTCKNFAQGIHANQASELKIFNNFIQNSTFQGINIRYTTNSIVAGNIIQDCQEYGIVIVRTQSSGNVVYGNILDGNTYSNEVNIDGSSKGRPSSQGYDEGTNNLWYNESTQQGNCWSDYKGRGSYSIDGSAESIDLYPDNCFNNRYISGYFGLGVVSVSLVIGIVLYTTKRKSK